MAFFSQSISTEQEEEWREMGGLEELGAGDLLQKKMSLHGAEEMGVSEPLLKESR